MDCFNIDVNALLASGDGTYEGLTVGGQRAEPRLALAQHTIYTHIVPYIRISYHIYHIPHTIYTIYTHIMVT